MKSFLKKIYHSELTKNIRNKIGFRPLHFNFEKVDENTSISDGFFWRTDNDFQTIFKFSDLFKLFYKIDNSYIVLKFYNHNFNLIKTISITKIHLSNEFLIDKVFLNNYEGHGIFFLFHKHNNFNPKNLTIISNRCYLGFSYRNFLPSFMHGNTYVVSENINNNKSISNFINISLFCNQYYRIQNNFSDFDKSEVIIVNPTTKRIKFFLNNKKYFLDGLNTQLIDIKKTSKIFIRSNCYYLRPIAFSYKNEFIDVYHL